MKKRNLFKLAALTAVFALGSMFANAQIVTESSINNIPKQQEAVAGQDSGYVKVIDNKGTVKFLQSINGITMFTNEAPSGGIVTTWQLGGTLSEDTYIDVNGNEFGIKGLDTVGTGFYQLIVTDPTTGELRRLAFDGLIQSGRTVATLTADVSTYAITMTGITLNGDKVYVYRNGAKLLAYTDYTITANTVTVTYNPLYNGDVIEVHYVK